MQKRVVWSVLVVLLLALLVFVYRTVTQDLDLRRGDELFAQQRFSDALPYYLRAMDNAAPFHRAKVIYRVAACYERLGDCDRANPFFIELLRDYPGSEWEARGKQGFLQCLRPPDPGAGIDGGTGAATPLLDARRVMRRRYNRLVLLLKENRSGVPAELEEAYRQYKQAYETYVEEIKQGFEALDRGG